MGDESTTSEYAPRPSGIQCTGCHKIHEGTRRCSDSEKTLFGVMDSTYAHQFGKQYFCSPVCYIAHRNGRVRTDWRSCEAWYAKQPDDLWPVEAVLRQFSAYKEMLHIQPTYSLEDARAGKPASLVAEEEEDEKREREYCGWDN
jgi:hypothetical protein